MKSQMSEQEQKYKETELGLLPTEWEVAKLGEVMSEVDLRLSNSGFPNWRSFRLQESSV